MCTFVHRDLVADKLEIARTLGLVTRYVVRPTKDALSVRVWRSPGTSEAAITDYLTRLLDGLQPGLEITILPQAPAEAEAAPRVDTPQIAAAA